MNNELPKIVYYVKEVAKMLSLTPTKINTVAKFLKIQKIFGTYRFTQVDIERIGKFVKGGEKYEQNYT